MPDSINRREFLRTLSATTASVGLAACGLPRRIFSGDFDTIIRGGTVVDGSGNPGFVADVGLVNGRIAALGDLSRKSANLAIDARRKVVCPGFIDLHSHSDLTVLSNGRADSKIRQGVTTEVIGQDGNSVAPIGWTRAESWNAELRAYGLRAGWRDFDGYFATLRARGSAVNVLSLVGAGTLRRYVAEMETRPLSDWELDEAVIALQKAHRQGACYLSAGLEYLPGAYATEKELVALARHAGLYVTHMRNEDDRVLDAIREAIRIARKSGAALHISHLKAQGRRNWGRLGAMLALLDDARGWRTTITCDRYPYLAYNNGLINLFPLGTRQGGHAEAVGRLLSAGYRADVRPAVQRKVDSLGSYDSIMLSDLRGVYSAHTGSRLGELARGLGRDPFDLLCDIVVSHGGGGSMVGFAMSEDNLIKLLQYPYCAIASDGAAMDLKWGARAHPRNFGTFPRVLGTYVREMAVLTLEEAVRKMTGLPAAIVGLRERGRLAPGFHGDVVVFDPERIADRATYMRAAYPDGIEHVLVGGVAVIHEGQHTGLRPGQPIVGSL